MNTQSKSTAICNVFAPGKVRRFCRVVQSPERLSPRSVLTACLSLQPCVDVGCLISYTAFAHPSPVYTVIFMTDGIMDSENQRQADSSFRGVANDARAYLPLEARSQEIRFLRLYPGLPDESVVCSLGYTTFDRAAHDRILYPTVGGTSMIPSTFSYIVLLQRRSLPKHSRTLTHSCHSASHELLK